MINEIIEGVDAHSYNCEHILKLPVTPENRTATKVFTFRMIYGGTPYAFYMDSNMPNFSLKRWEEIVEAFYKKYSGLHKWQKENFKEVLHNNGLLISPITGRQWQFKKQMKRGVLQYVWAEVCNYPVQGTAYDIIALWMALSNKELCQYPDVKLVMQVHDELVWDVPNEYVDIVAKTCYNICIELPKHIEKFFGVKCNVPLSCEVKVGSVWGNTEKYIM